MTDQSLSEQRQHFQHLDTDLAYIAGFVDGEGYIGIRLYHGNTITYGPRTYYTITLQITNTRKDVLEWIKDTMNMRGSICSKWSNKNYWKQRNYECYSLNYFAARAVSVLEMLLPFLKIKSKEAELAIDVGRLCRRRGGKHLTPEELETRESLRHMLEDMKLEGLQPVEDEDD